MTTDALVASALLDLSRAVTIAGADWALIGGQALIVYGVPRETLDADALVPSGALFSIAVVLVDTFDWTPLVYDETTDDYIESKEPTIHFMDDPVLFDVQEDRHILPLRTPLGLPVELLAAQHPVERELIDEALLRVHHGVKIPVAPLGGILLVKMKADRKKDVAAIEQTAEHLPSAKMQEAIAWARRRDPATAEDMTAVIKAARTRRVPLRKDTYSRPKR